MRHLGLSRDIKLKEVKFVSRKRGIEVNGWGVRTQTIGIH